ncbi:MAG TPA: ATP-binding cassette domain-containing protein [Thermoanaerobaculia bacterium]|nr:ATP-binding cassette domain-containing protein [Thermoanaerobaculia bacterium]
MRLTRITKTFGATRAVDDVSLDINAGEVLALVGENGAGKTTLMRVAAGELAFDSGAVSDRGAVGFVHQHFLLVPELTIAENLAVTSSGFRFATHRTLVREATEIIASTGIALHDASRRVADLSVGEKSKLELIKAIAKKPSTLILDEPTSVLTPHESEELFTVMRTLAANGTAIVFISHKLPEVLAVAQRIVVMRAGRIVLDTREATAERLARAMTQSPLPVRGERARVRGALAHERGDLKLHENEILAIVGVAGNGQSQLARALRDALPEAAHIPEDRTRDGIVADLSIAENLALRGVPPEAMTLYSVRAQSARQRAGDLSGGNQQKVILARELDRHPRIIVAAEPTRGLDLDATAFVHEKLRAAANGGAAILLITSDLDEAFALADTMQVIYRDELSERMTPEEAASRVANLMAGVA